MNVLTCAAGVILVFVFVLLFFVTVELCVIIVAIFVVSVDVLSLRAICVVIGASQSVLTYEEATYVR